MSDPVRDQLEARFEMLLRRATYLLLSRNAPLNELRKECESLRALLKRAMDDIDKAQTSEQGRASR